MEIENKNRLVDKINKFMIPSSDSSIPLIGYNFVFVSLFIDTKKELNVFQIKKNKLIYWLSNIHLFLSYIIPILILIAEIVILCINVSSMVKFTFVIIISSVSIFFWSYEFYRYRIKSSFREITNLYYLVHSKYLVDKFLYFYNVDLNDFATKKIFNWHYDTPPLTTINYLKIKDASRLKLINNPKNSGIICKLYSKDKEKAIELMKSNLNYFYNLAKYVFPYSFAFSILFTVIGVIYIPISII